MDCPACARFAKLRDDPASDHLHVADLAETVVVLHNHQRYEGWCVLLLKDHADHLCDVPVERQARVFREVAMVANAVRSAMKPNRLNYECLGNQMHHVHWHVIPRYTPPVDPDPRETIWVQAESIRHPGVDRERAAELVARIRTALVEERNRYDLG